MIIYNFVVINCCKHCNKSCKWYQVMLENILTGLVKFFGSMDDLAFPKEAKKKKKKERKREKKKKTDETFTHCKFEILNRAICKLNNIQEIRIKSFNLCIYDQSFHTLGVTHCPVLWVGVFNRVSTKEKKQFIKTLYVKVKNHTK